MKDVVITVRGLLGTDSEGEDIALTTDGRYAYGPEETRFEYMESELTGLDGTKTMFSVTKHCVTLTREGLFAMQMVFEEGQKNYFAYNTPYGTMTMGIDTMGILADLNESGGHLEVAYLLDMSERAVMKTAFTIDIREA